MKVVKVRFHEADREYYFLPEFSEGMDPNIRENSQVIVETTLGTDLGVITGWADWKPSQDCEGDNCKNTNTITQDKASDIKPMLRPVNNHDLKKAKEIEGRNKDYLSKCKELCDKHGLTEMKLIEVGESFDERRLTFYFISDTRVDFRELVRDLVKNFHRKIRLQQIGVRDAAKMCGDVGPCGLPLCCKNWLNVIGNVSPEFIKDQELSHRGADRMTGPCGRLKCCLRFEEEVYKYKLNKLPKVGDIINTGAGKGKVKSVHAMKQTVRLEIDGAIVEYPYLEGRVCKKPEDKK